jgi:rhodanese-related sulfurtransferase
METIGRQELKARLDANRDIKLVMTVGGWTFRARHIPGSLSFPCPGRALQTLRCDDEIILYSVSNGPQDTRAAFDALTAHGYRNVRCYQGGLADWEDADYPVEGTSVGSAAPRRWPQGTVLTALSSRAVAHTVTTAGQGTDGRRRKPRTEAAWAVTNQELTAAMAARSCQEQGRSPRIASPGASRGPT